MEQGTRKGLETLEVWQRSLDFASKVCKVILPLLPNEEKYSLTHQLRRAVQSIPANIAEAYGRYHYQDSIRFCYIARGSLEETYSHLALARELGYLTSTDFGVLVEEVSKLRRMLNGYILFLKRSKRGENEPGMTYPIWEETPPYKADIDLEIIDPTET